MPFRMSTAYFLSFQRRPRRISIGINGGFTSCTCESRGKAYLRQRTFSEPRRDFNVSARSHDLRGSPHYGKFVLPSRLVRSCASLLGARWRQKVGQYFDVTAAAAFSGLCIAIVLGHLAWVKAAQESENLHRHSPVGIHLGADVYPPTARDVRLQ